MIDVLEGMWCRCGGSQALSGMDKRNFSSCKCKTPPFCDNSDLKL